MIGHDGEGESSPMSKRLKAAPNNDNTTAHAHLQNGEDIMLEDALLSVMDYVPCFELSTAASVSKLWRTMASKSYHFRVNQACDQLSTNTAFLHPGTNDPKTRYMIDGYKKMKYRQIAAAKCGAYFQKPLDQPQSNKWRFRIELSDAGILFVDTQLRVGQVEKSILPLLPLEKDLPESLRSTNTKLEWCCIDKNGLFFIVLSHKWTPDYSEAIQHSLSLKDQYAHCVARWRDLEEEFGPSFEPDTHFWKDEGILNPGYLQPNNIQVPGYDVWGMLYHVETGKDSFPTTPQLVDVQRLYTEDFFGDLSSAHLRATRSENGRVVCIATGVAKDPQQERNTGTPTIRTIFLDKERGIDCFSCEPIEWPAQRGMENIHNELVLSPAGDCLLGLSYEEQKYLFYQYNKSTSTWTLKWGKVSHYFKGYYTADGDFCVFTDKYSSCTTVPGPMTTKHLLVLNPRDDWKPFDAQGHIDNNGDDDDRGDDDDSHGEVDGDEENIDDDIMLE
mmetsp:Transcript_8079/g.22422  ORF Transcript_8079/g.22422 Transcript_8079/m.22422 type:complete len:502 (-) Transcript_8079:114-1619(-)